MSADANAHRGSVESLTVIFQPSGRRAGGLAGEDLLSIARRAGVDIESSCGSKGTCGKCRVRLEKADPARMDSEGEDPVSAPTAAEHSLLGAALLSDGVRLACQTKVNADLTVFVPEQSRRSSHVMPKTMRAWAGQLDPAVKTYLVTLSDGPAAGGTPAARGLLTALTAQHGLAQLEVGPEAEAAISRLPHEAGAELVAVVWRETSVLDVHLAAARRPVLGLALDIGTTTIGAYLADLTTGQLLATESVLNPQVPYGDDIIARMQYAAHHAQGARELQEMVAATVDTMAERAAESCGATSADIYDVTLVGNTAIHHLVLGIPTESLRRAPFEPAVKAAIDTDAASIGLHLHPSCRLYALPNEAGFVGADNVAVIIAEEPYQRDDLSLLIDVGTNGELVLGRRDRMLSASCATGPAFEGAHIEHGMRATPGAIERVRIQPGTLQVSYKVIGTDAWSADLAPGEVKARGICGSGIIEAAAEMLRCGVILPDGNFAPDLVHERILTENGRPRKLVLARAEESATGSPITVSLKDIRALQLGKAALRAGADILLRIFGAERPDRVVLAGAFGSYIDTSAALTIGMLPACDPDSVSSVGNAAGEGALLALLSLAKRSEAENAASSVEYVELASVEDFQHDYVQAMRFEPSMPGLL